MSWPQVVYRVLELRCLVHVAGRVFGLGVKVVHRMGVECVRLRALKDVREPWGTRQTEDAIPGSRG